MSTTLKWVLVIDAIVLIYFIFWLIAKGRRDKM